MSRSLKALRAAATVGRILSTIVFICCTIGASACLVGLIALAAGEGLIVFGSLSSDYFRLIIDGKDLGGLIMEYAGLSVHSIFTMLGVGTILCAGEAVLAKFGEVYFRRELEAETPFTRAGARETVRLGILCMGIPAVSVMAAGILHTVMSRIFTDVADMESDVSSSLVLGVMFIILGIVFYYGTEQRESMSRAGETPDGEIVPAAEPAAAPAAEVPADEAPADGTPSAEAPAGDAAEPAAGPAPAEEAPAAEKEQAHD